MVNNASEKKNSKACVSVGPVPAHVMQTFRAPAFWPNLVVPHIQVGDGIVPLHDIAEGPNTTLMAACGLVKLQECVAQKHGYPFRHYPMWVGYMCPTNNKNLKHMFG